MAKKISKKINRQFNPSYIGGYPIFAYGGKMYGFGSFLKKAGQYAGDAGKIMADNALSVVGASDVIDDDSYKTDVFRGISKVTNPINQTLGGIGLGIAGLSGVQQSGSQMNNQLVQGRAQQDQIAQQQQEMLKQQAINNLPAQQNYKPTFADGGKVVKDKNYLNAWDNFYNLQGDYTKALADKYPNVPIPAILNSYANDSTFSNRKLDKYATSLIDEYGDFHLTPEEMDSIGTNRGIDVRNVQSTLSQFDKPTFKDSVNTTGTKEDTNLRFGPRMMLQKRYTKGQSPYKALDEFAYGGNLNNITDRLSEIDSGTTHEQSPTGGVPISKNALVEDDEFIFTTKKGDKYVFSNRLTVD